MFREWKVVDNGREMHLFMGCDKILTIRAVKYMDRAVIRKLLRSLPLFVNLMEAALKIETYKKDVESAVSNTKYTAQYIYMKLNEKEEI